MPLPRWVGRAIGLDVHRDFCVIAICEDGQVRSVGRVPSTPDGLATLAESLLASDRVALEVTGSCWEVARLLEPHVDRVIVVSPDDTGITQARACRGSVAGRGRGFAGGGTGCRWGWGQLRPSQRREPSRPGSPKPMRRRRSSS